MNPGWRTLRRHPPPGMFLAVLRRAVLGEGYLAVLPHVAELTVGYSILLTDFSARHCLFVWVKDGEALQHPDELAPESVKTVIKPCLQLLYHPADDFELL